MAKRKKPHDKFIRDLNRVFGKHNWSGMPIGISPAKQGAAGDGACPPGKTLKTITFQLPDGTWVTKDVCV